jgi:D-beta-D-heptose 7-phosphate kinase/D-beta-D-heptose 1-phosphate adenosyltransferase
LSASNVLGVDAARIDELLRDLSSVRALVVGDLMLDRYLTGTVDRVSPEAPVPVVRVQSERSAIGGAGNVAANVRSLGATCALVGCVGQDPEGDAVLAALESSGVSCEGVLSDGGRPTTVKTRVLAQRQQVVRFDREVDDAIDDAHASALAERVRAAAETCDVLIVQDYDKGVLAPPVIAAVQAAAKARGVPWVVDPKRRSFFAYGGATVFKPNTRELGDALGTRVCADDEPWMEEARKRVGCEHLLLTLGERGMSLQSRGASLLRLPAVARDVYDVSGAGDTVTAVVALALAARATMAEAAVLANHAAAVEVGKSGVHTVSPEEIRAHVSVPERA